ncbi:hypothetical protein [Amycolatopsis sp. NPDC051371]|uniref:hypothetical protein n=1 Tax=Amycolatopsis sp. NPDC051371 TaxID=3155800 RepID=UPI0034130FEE
MTTPSLATRARRLIEHLGDVKEREQDQQARSIVESVSARSQVCRRRLSATTDAVQDLERHEIPFPTLQRTLLNDIPAAKRTLRTTATTIERTDPRASAERARSQSVDSALATCERIAKELELHLARAAKLRRQQLLPADIQSPVHGYSGVSEALVVRLQSLQRTLQAPLPEMAVDKLVASLDRIAAQAEQWTREHPLLEAALEKHHPEIKEFLRLAATEGGAPWSAITPSVSQWLSDPANTADLKVVLRL